MVELVDSAGECSSAGCENDPDDLLAANGDKFGLPTNLLVPMCESCIETAANGESFEIDVEPLEGWYDWKQSKRGNDG